MKMNPDVIADIKKDYLNELAKRRRRISGREPFQCRNPRIETGMIETAEGSARVRLGDTDVLVGVRAEEGRPHPDEPCKGMVRLNCETMQIDPYDFNGGSSTAEANEVAGVVSRGIMESEAIDLASLVIEEGESVWIISIEIHVLDDNGNVFDAAGIGTLFALANTVIPASTEHGGSDEIRLRLLHLPVPATFVKIDGRFFIDPDLDEERVCQGKLLVTTDENGNIRIMHKSKGGRFNTEEMAKVIEKAVLRGGEVRQLLDANR